MQQGHVNQLASCALSILVITACPGSTDVPSPDWQVLVGAGDIAVCGSTWDESTADLLDNIPGTVFTTGDNAYEDGSTDDFTNCYASSWGRHRSRTRPSPGNHDYHTDGAAGYFSYFGAAAGDPEMGYYSYDLGTWHVIALNSNIDHSVFSPQLQWLVDDLAAHLTQCTVAYWHHPLFSSGFHGSDESMRPFWDVLYAAGVDIVLNGHDHNYERFAPQTPSGDPDPARGIRAFVVGTGGRALRPFGQIAANSEVRNSETFGVLKLTLERTGYRWEFFPVAGSSFTDSGRADCH